MRSRLGECLVRAGLVTDDQLRPAVEEQERTGERLGVVLARLRVVTEAQIADALAAQLGFRSVDLSAAPPDPAAVRCIDREVAVRSACIAVTLDKNVLTVAMADPLAFSLVPDLEAQTGYRIQEVVATRSAILAAIEAAYDNVAAPAAAASAEAVAPARDEGEDAQVVLSAIVERALEREATDIHLEPLDDRAVVRHRLDGRLSDVLTLSRATHEALVARIKVSASLDVAEKLLPQAGRLRVGGAHYRATTLRTLHGERVVLRPLEHRRSRMDLDGLDLAGAAADALRAWLRHDRGLVLVAGPAGSGRTATLHAALAAVTRENDRPGASVIAIEDPVEADLPGVTQAQVDDSIGLTFGTALRAATEQKADVLLIGELGDAETATLAAGAASADSLVVAAVIAEDAAAAAVQMARLAGAALAAASLSGVVAQRLVRRLCESCRRERTPSAEELRELGIPAIDADGVRLFEPTGCDRCDFTGFRGRAGIFEAMPMTERIRQLVAAGASRAEIRDAALGAGMVSLADLGVDAVRRGETTIGELRRTLGDFGEARVLCPSCGGATTPDFTACPRCGARLGHSCAHCGRALQPGWNFCPYCARTADAPGPSSKRAIIRLVRNPDTPGIV